MITRVPEKKKAENLEKLKNFLSRICNTPLRDLFPRDWNEEREEEGEKKV